jgi:hypothetical protein
VRFTIGLPLETPAPVCVYVSFPLTSINLSLFARSEKNIERVISTNKRETLHLTLDITLSFFLLFISLSIFIATDGADF